MPGIRICVYKPDGSRLTTIYVGKDTLTSLLSIADDNVRAVTHAARHASLTCAQTSAEPWSQTVLTGARKFLLSAQRKKLRDAESLENASLAAAAAENNAAWEYTDAVA